MTWGSIGAATISVVGGYLASKSSKHNTSNAQQAAAHMDPYGPYRSSAAAQLNALVQNPNSIATTGDYKARQLAASRLMAAQGYTGSGNALVAASNAGGAAYQQAFNNLAMLSGAGVAPGSGAMQSAQLQQQNNQNTLNGYSNAANSLVYAGQNLWNHYYGNTPPIDTGGIAQPQVDTSTFTYTPPDITNPPITPPPIAPVGIVTE